jgi:hypothetical protein
LWQFVGVSHAIETSKLREHYHRVYDRDGGVFQRHRTHRTKPDRQLWGWNWDRGEYPGRHRWFSDLGSDLPDWQFGHPYRHVHRHLYQDNLGFGVRQHDHNNVIMKANRMVNVTFNRRAPVRC